ncbi:hypothetical protein GF339_14425 [candidate division KSB3 bacterium]|uniref:Adenylate cyclase n=1 Tax=candidate division KSB3 bacterium TaxID=2044937 RepID=A0A9D5JWV5_9BACT|nr:hypothetical protein [candidate division KSB3 bacterium]MBD3325779.1 hypothetical protein [candidate division KSB3 bacterium]
MRKILDRVMKFHKRMNQKLAVLRRVRTRLRRLFSPLFRRFTQLPKRVSPRHYRFFVLSNYCYFFALIGHAAAIPLTELVGARRLTLLNLGSVLIYLLALRLNLWGFLKVNLPVVVLEGVAFVVLTAYTLGNIGINALLIPLAMFVFLSPLQSRLGKGVISVVIGAAYAAANYYVQTFTPSVMLGSLTIKILNFTTSCVTIATACFLGYYYQIAAIKAEGKLEQEYHRAENLLHNILPESIATRLKLSPETIADGFEGASILFADIVGFTPLSEQMTPEKTVMLLNEIFSAFDDLVDKYGLEKIKTIGDAYMVVAGLPQPRPDHAEAIAEMALDIMTLMDRFAEQLHQPLQIRIGINSGPAVAGVIGKKKFIYDLWGDTVNTASRMESHGVPGEIQVTKTTHDLLEDSYTFENRGLVEIKGKGRMQVYLLKGKRPRAAHSAMA